LRELADSGVIERYVHQQIPPRVDYSLTPLGRKLAPILYAMHDWGEEVEKRRSREKSYMASVHQYSSNPAASRFRNQRRDLSSRSSRADRI